MIVMIGSSNESLEHRPDVFNMVRGAKVPCLMDAGAMEVPKELGDALIAHGSIGPDHASSIHVMQQELIGRALFTILCHAKDDSLGASLIDSKDDSLIPMPSFA